MRDIFKFLWKYRLRVALGLAALALVDATSLITPLVIRRAIDGLTLGQGQGARLWALGLIIVGLAVFGMAFRFLWRYFLIGSARRIERELRARFYDHLLKLSTPYYTRTKTGDLMAHATNDMDAVMRACGFGVLTLADAVIMTTASLFFMVSISWSLTLYAIVPLPLVTVVVLGLGRVIHRRFETVQEVFSKLMEKVREAASGIRVVKSFVQEEGMGRDYDVTNREFIEVNMRLVKVWGLFDPSIALLAGLGTAIVLWAGGRGVITQAISLGDFVAFTAYLGMLVWPMMALGWMVNLLQRGSASMNRIKVIFDTLPEITSPPPGRARPFPPRSRASLRFRDLTFAYDGGPPVLRGIDLEVEAGQILGVVGVTGTGKSTLAHLVPRLFDPPPGTVLIGGVDVREMDLSELRRHIGVVPQDPFLFSTTVRENIRFGRPEASEAEVIRAAQLAGIYEEILEFPDGLDTRVGERGVSLSGGQKQRVGIARALLLDPPILILDDCLSAVDAEKEELILHNLREVLQARTSIVIAHRISAVKEASQIIVLEDGQIVEQGTHAQLVANEGTYARLYQLQQAEFSVALET